MCHNSTQRIQLWIVTVTCGLLGVSMLLMGHHNHIQLVTDFYRLTDHIAPALANQIAAIAVLICAVLALISIRYIAWRRSLGLALIVVSFVPLISLFSEAMWISGLGGFPAIGAGQGIIKYFSLLVIGILLWRPLSDKDTWGNYVKWLSLFPVLLVLLWIGGMKFTGLEAKGIEPLVQSSPLMSWMYQVWDVQTTSDLIGIYDLLTVAILLMGMFYRNLLLPGIVMSALVFIVTQTFLFSWNAATSADTILSTGGHFLIKDLWYIGNLVTLYYYCQPSADNHQA